MLEAIVVAAPVKLDCLESIWDCIFDVTSFKYSSSVDVISDTSTLPLEFETNTLDSVKLFEVIDVTAPVK